jgi:hypothetical protein
VLDDEFVFSGLDIVAVKARPARIVRRHPDARLVASAEALGEDGGYQIADIPRGGLTSNRIYFLGSNRQLHILDAKGNVDSRRGDLPIDDLCNLLLSDGLAVVCRAC